MKGGSGKALMGNQIFFFFCKINGFSGEQIRDKKVCGTLLSIQIWVAFPSPSGS